MTVEQLIKNLQKLVTENYGLGKLEVMAENYDRRGDVNSVSVQDNSIVLLQIVKNLNPQAHQLADYMSELSEDRYCAGWNSGVEYELWGALHGLSIGYSFDCDEYRDMLSKLKDLSNAASGWIYFDDVNGETFISIPEWENRFTNYNKNYEQLLKGVEQ